MARQFNLIPPVCEQAEYHLFQREKVEVQLPELYHKIGEYSLTRQNEITFLLVFVTYVHTSSVNPSFSISPFISLQSPWRQELVR